MVKKVLVKLLLLLKMKAIMFDNIEECFLFRNGLDHEIEEYELERDNTP